jgi:hypothetical protein
MHATATVSRAHQVHNIKPSGQNVQQGVGQHAEQLPRPRKTLQPRHKNAGLATASTYKYRYMHSFTGHFPSGCPLCLVKHRPP